MKLVALGLPAYSNYDSRVCLALMDLGISLERRGIGVQRVCISQNPDIAFAHNQILTGFLKGPAERLLIVDSDIVFSAPDALKLVQSDLDFVGGNYRKKGLGAGMACRPKEESPDDREIVEADFLATGFCCLSKRAVRELAKGVETYNGTLLITKSGFNDGKWMACDEFLSRAWQRVGGTCYVDTSIRLGHVGITEFR